MASQATRDAQAVANDMELAEGVFVLGGLYHIRTPTYQYIGTLKAVTPTVFMFVNTATVYITGNYPDFYAGQGKQIEAHTGAEEMIIDRAATVLHRINRAKYSPE